MADEVDGGGTGGSGGSYAPAGGATGGCTYSMYWNYCGGSNDNISHPGGPPPICGGDGSGAGWVLETSCPNYTDITIFHKSSGAKSDCPNCETGPSGDVVMYSYDRSVAKLDYYMRAYFDQYLTPSELTWLNIHPDMAYNINQPLKTGGFTTRNLAIAYAKLKTYMHPGNTEYANRLSNLITGKAVSAFPYIKYPADKATLYRNQYPKLTEYLEKQLPKVSNNPTIVNAFMQYTNMTEAQVKQTLDWGNGPEIVIKQLGSISGHFSEPNTLEIDMDLINNLENAISGSTYSESLLFFIAVTLLHEAVHYGDYKYNNDYWIGNDPYTNEEGWRFENQAYGGAVLINEEGEITIVPLN